MEIANIREQDTQFDAVQSGRSRPTNEMVERFGVHNRLRLCSVLPRPAAIPVPERRAEGARRDEEARSPELS